MNKIINPAPMLVRYLHKTLELERMKQKKLDLSSATVRSNDGNEGSYARQPSF